MLLVACEPENIPPWIYPAVLPDFPNPGSSAQLPEPLGEAEITALWQALDSDSTGKPLREENSHCEVGFPHDAPESVPALPPELIAALAKIPAHERWRIAEGWAEHRFGQKPNEAMKSRHKKLLNPICDLADTAQLRGHAMVLIEPET